MSKPSPPVSPVDCRHDPLFIQSGSGGPPYRREHVSVCRRCGQFRVFAEKDGVQVTTTFELPTDELVRAAGQFARLLRADMEEEKARKRARRKRPVETDPELDRVLKILLPEEKQ